MMEREESAMSPSKKSVGPRGPRKIHVHQRHDRVASPPHAHSFLPHILELEAVGWHVVRLRPKFSGDEPPLWRVTIERYDESASMTMVESEPDVALAELARYARADAR